MSKSELENREKKLESFSGISLTEFKDEHYYDMNFLMELIEGYCELFDPDKLRSKIGVSLRKAMIATFQERLVRESGNSRDRNSFSYTAIKNGAQSDYNTNDGRWQDFPTLEEVHPSDPNLYYENKGKARGHYRKAILQIAVNRAWMLKDDEDYKIYSSLKDIFDDL